MLRNQKKKKNFMAVLKSNFALTCLSNELCIYALNISFIVKIKLWFDKEKEQEQYLFIEIIS